ncbi:MarR family winged helix-turn-helix transcriptional regulator [Paenibacillus protaetiae]
MSVLGKIGVKALAEEFHLDVSTISRQTSALEEKGYVMRTPDPDDGRASYFELTDLGREKLRDAQAYRMSRFKRIFEEWNDEDLQKFGHYMVRVNRTFID